LTVLFLAVAFSSAGWAEGNYQRLLELSRARRWGEAVALIRTLIADYPEPTHLQSIANSPEVTELLRLPEWPSLQAAYFDRLDAEVGKRNSVPYEFECRGIKEQWARFTHIANPDQPFPTQLDLENTARLKEVVAQQGWPRKSTWGEGPAQAAWMILQHSPDTEFQAEMLPMLAGLLPEKECSASGYALLYDRVQLRHGRPQRFGSQVRKVDGRWEPVPPLQEPERLDALRSEMGLPPMADYLKQIEKMYDLPPRGWFH